MEGSPTRTGVLAATAAYLTWGLAPVYWKLLQAVPALELLAHRIVWSFVLVIGWLALSRRLGDLAAAWAHPGTRARLLATTGLIGVNWGLFIWAVNSGHILQASLGYYINPLVSVLLGLVVLGERLSRGQGLAVALAAVGVAVLAVSVGSLPWVSLALAGSFGLYGLLRKTVRADAVLGLGFETSLLTPFALALLVTAGLDGRGAFGRVSATTDGLLAFTGVLTAVPLLLFTAGARRLPLNVVGLLQYITPTCHFALAVAVYHEPFSRAHAVTFALIWSALALYTADARRRIQRQRR
jgi:chloramphenicol-sensitive protein RarD